MPTPKNMHHGYVVPLRLACKNRMIKVRMGKMRMCTIKNKIERGSTKREGGREKETKTENHAERGARRDIMRFNTQKRKPCKVREGER